MKVKEALDELFEGIKFDKALYLKVVENNIGFITSTTEHKELFGSRLIGCFHSSYTQFHKNTFYENVLEKTYEEVKLAVDRIKSIPSNFKVARDDINLVTMYMAHRFLKSPNLDSKLQKDACREILTYFNYRTLVLTSSDYWVYPISEEMAVSLIERLNNKYIIKKLKNWNEYCYYRTDTFMSGNIFRHLVQFRDDKMVPKLITDLYNGTKETLKHIYREFLDLIEEDSAMRSGKSVITDLEGKEVLVDKTESPTLYVDKVVGTLIDANSFIKRDRVEVTVSIIDSISITQLNECLTIVQEYYVGSKSQGDEVTDFISNFLINCFEYLQVNETKFGSKGNVIEIVNRIVGNVLYTRGTDASITAVKEQGDKLIKNVYKKARVTVGDRSQVNLRNALCIYVLLTAIT